MTVGAIVNEIHEIIEQKTPEGTSPFEVLKRAIDSFNPQKKGEISENQAKAIVLARGALARKKLEEAEGGAISGEEAASLLGLKTRQGVDYLRKRKLILAWRNTTGKWNYPLLQFTDGRVRP